MIDPDGGTRRACCAVRGAVMQHYNGGTTMKETGITRHLDDMGRIVLPVELRRRMNLDDGTPVEIFTEGERIILQKHRDVCVFCGGEKDLSDFKGRSVCNTCRAQLADV